MTFIFENQTGETPNNGILTIKQNDTTLGTFGANQATDEIINIQGGTVDYYDKAQTDALLDGKEDAFDLDAPLSMDFVTSSINIKIVDNLVKQNEIPPVGIGQYVTGSPTSIDFLTAPTEIYYSNVDTMDKFFAGGYIDVPLPSTGSYSFMTGNRIKSQNFVLGKGTGNDFIPIALLNPEANYAGGLYLNMSDTYSFNKPQYNTTLQISSSPVNVYSSFGFDGGPVTSSLDTAVSIDRTNPSSYTIHYNFPVDNNDNNWWGFYQVVNNASYISRLDEITTLRIFINDRNAGYNINNIGVYSYVGVLYNISKEQLGSNRVNIAGLINGANHLQLSIGAGLAVQNGALVNTNPTILETTQTEYEALVNNSAINAKTLYIVTDAGAIYFGTTLIAQKN